MCCNQPQNHKQHHKHKMLTQFRSQAMPHSYYPVHQTKDIHNVEGSNYSNHDEEILLEIYVFMLE